ncbi:LDH2 family malate/lactate/ureidoglycolate dehydrogenase [Arthrobacter sp. PL16]|uniref:Ldh family oxidoreductase n=1 Tax=Arthrobacter sp. PL16 TaxID=3071720 RepID=UPI002E0ACFBF|nr:LDH2 family malate/lactate/ureidoglycolate dehydrogenase [Arthrobacter sp. PL16]
MNTQQLFPQRDLVRFAAQALAARGVPREDADLTARSLVQADQRGIYSHGLLRLPLYCEALRLGGINPAPKLKFSKDQGSVAVLDADAALGQVAMQAAVDRVVRVGREQGIAAVAVHNSSHYGAGAFWSDQLAEAGFLSFITSSTGPVVAPHGGTSKVLGTNPLTLGVPSASGWPLTADLATSNGAYGKVIAAKNEGTQLPEGWAVDADGKPTTDPVEAEKGSMIPFGGHKGSAVAVLLEAFAASLTDATFAFETVDIWSNPASRMNNGHLVIGLDTAAFAGSEKTASRVAALQDRVRSSGPGGQPVDAPGDPERRRQEEAAETVPLPPSTVSQLAALAEDLSLSPLETHSAP